MRLMLRVQSWGGIMGTIRIEGDRLVASTPGLQGIADRETARTGSAQAAFDYLSGRYNGYVSYALVPEPDYKGPGHWRSQAEQLQEGEPEEAEDQPEQVGLAHGIVSPYNRRSPRGREERVSGYVQKPRGGYIPPDKWREGQQVWRQRGEEAWAARRVTGAHGHKTYPLIHEAQRRGNSRAVTPQEFHKLASQGNSIIDKMKRDKSPITGLDENWEDVKGHAWKEVQKPWGGATIDAHTGHTLDTDADKYAMSVKPARYHSVSVPENATEEQFRHAMDEAKETFRPVLERRAYHLGVFHDNDLKRIDIDPVVVVDSPDEVEKIGAYARSIGGAYHFRTGNGYFPPHVPDKYLGSTEQQARKAERGR